MLCTYYTMWKVNYTLLNLIVLLTYAPSSSFILASNACWASTDWHLNSWNPLSSGASSTLENSIISRHWGFLAGTCGFSPFTNGAFNKILPLSVVKTRYADELAVRSFPRRSDTMPAPLSFHFFVSPSKDVKFTRWERRISAEDEPSSTDGPSSSSSSSSSSSLSSLTPAVLKAPNAAPLAGAAAKLKLTGAVVVVAAVAAPKLELGGAASLLKTVPDASPGTDLMTSSYSVNKSFAYER